MRPETGPPRRGEGPHRSNWTPTAHPPNNLSLSVGPDGSITFTFGGSPAASEPEEEDAPPASLRAAAALASDRDAPVAADAPVSPPGIQAAEVAAAAGSESESEEAAAADPPLGASPAGGRTLAALKAMKVADLRGLAVAAGATGVSKMKKADLVALLADDS